MLSLPTAHTRSLTLARTANIARAAVRAGLVALLCAPILLAAEPARAEPGFEGRFRGRGEGLLTLRVSPAGAGGRGDELRVVADTAVPNECTGGVSGLARRVDASTLRLRERMEGSDRVCELVLRYSADRARVTMEATGCEDFRGMSCDFAGTLKRR